MTFKMGWLVASPRAKRYSMSLFCCSVHTRADYSDRWLGS